jgi:hypothetical protein
MRALVVLLLIAAGRPTQAQPDTRSTNEIAGMESVIDALVSAFDRADVVALGDDHWRKADSDIRIRVIRHPAFPRKVRLILVEFASTAQQATLDRYISGADLPLSEVRKIWQTTTQTNGVWDSPLYAEFLANVREVNKNLPESQKLRVLAGDPPGRSGLPRDETAFSVLKKHLSGAPEKALVIYGAAHLWRTSPKGDAGLVNMLEASFPGRVFSVIAKGGEGEQYQRFERALRTPTRPVLVQLGTQPFRDFPADDFFGNDLKKRVNGEWVSAFQDSGITLGQMADACIYLGMDASVDTRIGPSQ